MESETKKREVMSIEVRPGPKIRRTRFRSSFLCYLLEQEFLGLF